MIRRASTNGEGADGKEESAAPTNNSFTKTGGNSKSWLPQVHLDRKTLRDTYKTIAIVVASRVWDFFFTDHLMPLVLGETQGSALIECGHSTVYFLALLPAGAVLLVFTATPRIARSWRTADGSNSCGPGYRSAYVKLCVPAVGMALGWSFSSVVISCDKEIDVLKAHALTSAARQWNDFTSWLTQRLAEAPGAFAAAPGNATGGDGQELWSGAVALMASVFDDAAMAIAFNVLAVLILATAVRVNSMAGRGTTATTRHPALEWSLRIEYLLTECLALGAAAPWRAALNDLVPIHAYAECLGSGACAAEGLPSPLLLSGLYTFTLTTVAALASLRLTHMEEVAHGEIAAFIQASIRGVTLRWHLQEAKDALGMQPDEAGSAASSPTSHPSPAASPLGGLAGLALGQKRRRTYSVLQAACSKLPARAQSAPVVLQADEPPAAAAEPPKSSGGTATEIFERLGVAFRASKRLQIELTRMRCLVLLLLKKILGFLVGWAWFELAAQVYPSYVDSLSGVVTFAVAVTLICTSWAVSSGKGAVALTAREAKLAMRRMDRGLSERVFVTHALGLVQGWAWVDVVDGGIKALLATPYLVALSTFLPDGVSDLLVTLVITALVTLGLLHGIWLFARQMARVNWKTAKRKSRTKKGVLSMIATLSKGSIPAAAAAAVAAENHVENGDAGEDSFAARPALAVLPPPTAKDDHEDEAAAALDAGIMQRLQRSFGDGRYGGRAGAELL